MKNRDRQSRILTIDIARFYTMALVFYGHFIERIMYLNNPNAAAHYKFVYAFHMTLFFILAGYVAKERDLGLRFGTYVKRRFLSRLLPFIFFTFLFMIPAGFFPGEHFHLQLPSLKGYAEGLLLTLFGMPLFCVPSWFLLMLFSVEIIHYGAFRFLKTNAGILIGAVGFYVVGYILNWQINFLDPVKGRVVGWNYLFIHEAVAMYGFYLFGVFLRRKKWFVGALSPKIWAPGAAAAFLFVLFTYRLNSGRFSFEPLDAVVIMLSSHGHFFWFPVTALAGAFMILFMAEGSPARKSILWLGHNTLLLMCLNGIFYHFINPPAAKWVMDHTSGAPLTIFGAGCFVTAASLLLCMPLIYLFNTYVPQLVGKPKINGPLLKNLIDVQEDETGRPQTNRIKGAS